MDKHTPGPWWQDDDGCIAAVSGDEYVTVCEMTDGGSADLIAAAPDMLAALREAELGFLSAYQMFSAIHESDPSVDRAKARDRAWEHRLLVLKAIAKAEGR